MTDTFEDLLKDRIFPYLPELPSSEELQSILDTDPLDLAEKLTGKSYKTDKETELLGLGMHITHVQFRKQILESIGDTTFSNTLERYLRIIGGMGFEEALKIPFKGSGYSENDPIDEVFYIFIHRTKGLMLYFDTFGGDSVNGSHLLFAWKPIDGKEYSVHYSGGWESESDPKWRHNPKYEERGMPEDSYIPGSIDAREAFKHQVKQLDNNGTLLVPWPKYDGRFMWLLHYMDTKEEGYDYKTISAERIAMMPQWARDVINM